MSTPNRMTLLFDPYDYDFHEDPYPTYARLRAEAPLYHAVTEEGADDFWAISRHEDVAAALRDDETYSNRRGVSLDASAWNEDAHRVMSFLALDGAAQTRLRKLVSAGFTPRRVRELEPQIQALTGRYLSPLLEAGGGDWIAELAGRLPMDVISEMMGVPEPDRDHVRMLADLVVHREDGVRDVPEAGMTAALELITYYSEMVTARRKHPTDDLTSALLEAEIDGDRLRDHEIIAFLFLMVVAGNETTTKLLGNAVFHLASSPDQLADVLADPGLVPAWIEETLRHDTSSQMLARYVARDVELHGQVVPEGSKLLVLLGSANRDESVFATPDVFDLHRSRAELAKILSFGVGRHFCLGANLARLEARVVLDQLVRRVDSFSVDASRAQRVHSTSVRGFAELPVALTPRKES